jgi:hypothetical protein
MTEENIECCHICGHPKIGVNLSDISYAGWPACSNPICMNYGQSLASCWYRSRGDLRDSGIDLPPVSAAGDQKP